jgi:alpha-ketoglutarate-dependent taurine dioxygenase
MEMDQVRRPVEEFRSLRREAVRLSPQALVKTSYLDPEEAFPLVLEPDVESLNLSAWARGNQEFIEGQLLKHGALLFRNFNIDGVAQFEQFSRAIAPDLLDYVERAAPRKEVGSQIYTSTEFPPDQYIPLHHELAHSHSWPAKIWFFCAQPAAEGGVTPIANDRKVFPLIAPKIKEGFIRKKVMYVRNYGEGVDMSWQEVFQSNDRAEVEEYCRKAHMECEWKDRDHVRMRAVRRAVVSHPKTGEVVWFNHAHMFHMSNLEPEVRESLLTIFKEDELPRNAFYGDGSPIESSVLDEIRGIYDRASVRFAWRKGDVLMLDNLLASHGRDPFVGPRRILVAMA